MVKLYAHILKESTVGGWRESQQGLGGVWSRLVPRPSFCLYSQLCSKFSFIWLDYLARACFTVLKYLNATFCLCKIEEDGLVKNEKTSIEQNWLCCTARNIVFYLFFYKFINFVCVTYRRNIFPTTLFFSNPDAILEYSRAKEFYINIRDEKIKVTDHKVTSGINLLANTVSDL